MLTEKQIKSGVFSKKRNIVDKFKDKEQPKIAAIKASSNLIKTNKIGYRKLNNGKIIKSVDEQYVRDDLTCGVRQCPLCQAPAGKSKFLRLVVNIVSFSRCGHVELKAREDRRR